jgi:hypothetical protein
MSFEWNRIHKWEENIERDVTDAVYERVTEHYGVEEIEELTAEQVQELELYRNESLNEYSVMQIGFSNLINHWEDANYED